MTKRIFRSILAVAAAAMLVCIAVTLGCAYNYFGSVQKTQLTRQLDFAAVAVEREGEDYLKQVQSDEYRLTWIAADGKVKYDTVENAAALENHAKRTEVALALKNGEGESERYSSTLMRKTVYYAKRLSDGTVLRISVDRVTVWLLVIGMVQPLAVVAVGALILSAFIARRLSRRIVEPINSIDLDNPLADVPYDELKPLLHRISGQSGQIASQLRKLKRRQAEFDLITANMNEGLILLDRDGRIVSINPAASAIFDVGGECVGTVISDIDGISDAVYKAFSDGRAEGRFERNERIYQLDVSRVRNESECSGAVILVFDVTDKDDIERTRREFTANVSHELKTPIQGIIGSADLIAGGLVKAEDMPRFVGHIKSEAERLLALIEDIIRLSQLDEGSDMPREEVDLTELGTEVAGALSGVAKSNGIIIAVDGEKTEVNGVRRLLYEVIFNLCDNAVKYNRPGGRVCIDISGSQSAARIKVSDNGIGIPSEHLDHVFERFYRVDKSHSKASGGTGLGLSIVKHAVAYHGGNIDIKSEPGKGTEITVTIPKNPKKNGEK